MPNHALTCTNVGSHPVLRILHPVLDTVHQVSRNAAQRSLNHSTHAEGSGTTVVGSDQIDVRFISTCLVPLCLLPAAHQRQVERHALEAQFMDSVLMYVKFIKSASGS